EVRALRLGLLPAARCDRNQPVLARREALAAHAAGELEAVAAGLARVLEAALHQDVARAFPALPVLAGRLGALLAALAPRLNALDREAGRSRGAQGVRHLRARLRLLR